MYDTFKIELKFYWTVNTILKEKYINHYIDFTSISVVIILVLNNKHRLLELVYISRNMTLSKITIKNFFFLFED